MRKLSFLFFISISLTFFLWGKNLPTSSHKNVLQHLEQLRPSDYQQGEVIVKLRSALTGNLQKSAFGRKSIDKILQQYTGVNIKPIFSSVKNKHALDGVDLSKYYSVYYAGPIDAKEVAKALLRSEDIEYAEPRVRLRIFFHPNDSLYAAQWHLPIIMADSAWNITQGDSTIIIAIVDTGVDWLHPDLAANIWNNPGEIGLDAQGRDKRYNGIDDDNDGYIDDWHGWDLYQDTNKQTDNDPRPGNPHGTHVAGIAAAVTNNHIGVAGVAPKCKILPVKVASDDPSSNNIPFGYEGIAYATLMNANIINCSWGGSFSLFGQDMVSAAINHGCTVVAAAGNDTLNLSTSPEYPACYDGVLCVGATDWNDQKSSYSNYGYEVSLSAPGDIIESTIPTADGSYAQYSGTSMATPVVSGVAALVKSLHKDYTSEQVAEQVRVSADPIDIWNGGFQHKLGFGRVNAYRALTVQSPAIRVSSSSVSDSVTGNGNGMLEPGETMRISLYFTNYLQSTSSMSISITADPQLVTFKNSAYSGSGLGTLETNSAPITFDAVINSNIPENSMVECFITISSGSYSDYSSIQFRANQTFFDQNINNITMTITSAGNIGYNDYPNNQEGSGFIFTPTGKNNYLFEGAFIAGTDTVHLVDCARGNNQNYEDNDFESVSNFKISTPGSVADQQGIGEFATTQSASARKLNLDIKYASYAWKNAPNNNSVFVKYLVINRSQSVITNMYAGLYLDWDLGSAAFNIAAVDTTLRLGYAYDTEVGGITSYVGVVMLGDKPLDYHAIDNAATDSTNWGLYDGFTKKEKWDALHNGISSSMAGPSDISMVVGCGPFTLAPGDTAMVPFSFVADQSLEALKATATQARSQWNSVHSMGINNNSLPFVFKLHQNYPNPFNGSTHIHYEIPSAGNVTLKVYDILGREVSTLINGVEQPGLYDVAFPSGKNLASGIYFYRLTAAGKSDVKKMVLIK